MAVQRVKISVNAARFPLISTKGSRAVLVPGLDSAPRTPRQYVGNDNSVDYNTAQVLYCENVMPVAEGLRSVGWQSRVAGTAFDAFRSLIPLRNDKEDIVLYSPAGGLNFIYNQDTLAWESFPWEGIWGEPVGPGSTNTPSTAKVTYAFVAGITMLCYSRLKSAAGADMSIMFWDNILSTLEAGTFAISNLPWNPGEIDGIASSNGFLLMYSGLTIAWARYDGAGFNYSPYENGNYTGSGSQIPEDIGGPITAVVSAAGGFIMFTARNAVAAIYNAQNLVSPWTFREIPGAGGVSSYEQVAVEGSSSAIYAYTTAGFQRLSLNSSESVFPAASDFISGRQVEGFSPINKTLARVSLLEDLYVKTTNIGNRYFCVSYGFVPSLFEYILVYDMSLERWGKLKIQHTDCFSASYAPVDSVNTLIPAQHALAVLTRFGGVSIAAWSDLASADRDQGVAIIGRVALSRSRNTQLNRVEVEGMEHGTLHIVPSYDGATDSTAVPYVLVGSTPQLRVFGGDLDCKNFQILIEGAFDLSTVIIEAQPTGQI